MNIPLFFFLLAILGLGSLWIGKKTAIGTKTNDDFYLMGRSIGFFPLTMTFLATQLGGGAVMGAAEEAYARGWSVLFYPLGMVLGLIVLALGFGAKMRRLNLTTVAELFEKVYQSLMLRKIAALLSIASLFFILVAQAIAGRKFFAALGLNGDVIYALFWMVLVIYTMMGGMKAIVQTDILQACYILFAFLIAFVAFTVKGNPQTVTAPLVEMKQQSVPWMTWLLMPLLFMLIEQDMGQRCFAAKKPSTVTLASIAAALLLLVSCLFPIYFGVKASEWGVVIPKGSSVLIAAAQSLTGPTIATFIVCAVLMAIISTADSLLNSICSNLSCDFPFLKKQPLIMTRGITLAVGIVTLALSYVFDNVISMLMFSYEIAVSVLFVPVLFGVILKNPKKISAIVSMIFGALGFFLFKEVSYKEIWTLGLSLTGFGICEGIFFTPSEKVVTLKIKNED